MRMQLYVAAVVANAVRAPPQPPRGAPLTPQWPRPLLAPPLRLLALLHLSLKNARYLESHRMTASGTGFFFFFLPGCRVRQSFVPFAC